ncbi:MAG TPA: GNAT family N-acetyltransferase [Cyanobacteria bacterium UBA11369]|nr:GNAT family N-acetyltransferase [Cyanobacteria bacterium UBA11371]HBE51705.1 GNAT family N-acetyltransferase [Cyanobacteria bacterium UBA11369]
MVAQSRSASQFHIRGATPKDLTALAEILADSFHSRTGINGWIYPVLRLGIYEDIRNRLNKASPHYVCLVAVVSPTSRPNTWDYPAGTVEMSLRSKYPWPLDSSQYPYLSNLAVHQDCRRQGAAKQLLLKCESIALTWGFQDLYLHVLENNHKAQSLYFKLGYRLHESDRSWGSLLLGQPRRLLLHKRLHARTG